MEIKGDRDETNSHEENREIRPDVKGTAQRGDARVSA